MNAGDPASDFPCLCCEWLSDDAAKKPIYANFDNTSPVARRYQDQQYVQECAAEPWPLGRRGYFGLPMFEPSVIFTDALHLKERVGEVCLRAAGDNLIAINQLKKHRELQQLLEPLHVKLGIVRSDGAIKTSVTSRTHEDQNGAIIEIATHTNLSSILTISGVELVKATAGLFVVILATTTI
jgi:hypothetical protein